MTTASGHYGVLGPLTTPLALGLLQLSTEGRPSEGDAVAVIRTALDRGIRVLDTADSYALSDKDFHYGERLARLAVSGWSGAVDEVRIVTKAGLTRPKGRWVPNGRPEHLRRTVDKSLEALGTSRIFMLLLHVRDPGVPFEETLGTLAELQREGKIEHLGLCNTSVAEVRQAERHFRVRAMQNELSVVDRSGATEGLVALAAQLEIPLMAHRPLGGHAKKGALAKNRALKPIVSRLGISPEEAALAVLLDLDPPVIPVFGATRVESVESSVKAISVRLDAEDRAALATRISLAPTPEALASIEPIRPVTPTSNSGDAPEVVLVMGVQGSGKSSEVDRYLARGYARLNRDELGGDLAGLLPKLGALLASGQKRVVLDNTYGTRFSRFSVIQMAHAHGVPVRCVYMATPLDEAYVNVVLRVLGRYGRLLGPDDMKTLGKTDPNLPPPQALARFAASFERPEMNEGFSAVEEIKFERRVSPKATTKGLLLDVDGTIRKTKSGEKFPTTADDVELLPGRREALKKWVDDGYTLFFVSNQSGVASGTVTAEAAEAAFAKTIELLGLPVAEVLYCPHPAFPVGCFCRKPLPGLGVALIEKHSLSREHLVMVGDLASDEGLARAVGARYIPADVFFAGA